MFFPPSNKGYWTAVLPDWCKQADIAVEPGESAAFQIRARMKREHILAFISYLYDDDESYNNPEKMLTWKGEAYLVAPLVNFKAFVHQNLSKRLWYYVEATEEY